MARKRLNVAKKRVLKKASNKNADFVVQSLPELKHEQLEQPIHRKDGDAAGEQLIDIPSESSGKETMTTPAYNFGRYSDDEDVDMVEQPSLTTASQIPRTYRRKKSIENLLQDWEVPAVPCEPSGSNPDSTIQIVHIESLYESTNVANGTPDVVILNAQPVCSCGKFEELEKYIKLSECLQKEKETLLLKNAKLEAQNAKLQDSLTSKLLPTPDKPFKEEEEGFLDSETLQRMSHEASDKDYLFLKFVMMKLFPEGFVGRSVTGRTSNNPSGRRKKIGGGVSDDLTGNGTAKETFKVPLDPVKVKWIKRRLYDRRLFLGDDAATANTCYRGAGRLMTRIIANASR